MPLSREITILARIVDVVCWDEREQKIGGQGLSANRDAIEFLEARGVIRNSDCHWSRSVRADWAVEDWRTEEGVLSTEIDQDAIDQILYMLGQHIGNDKEQGTLTAWSLTRIGQIMVDALEFLSKAGIIEIFHRETSLVSHQLFSSLIGTRGFRHREVPRTYSQISARLIDCGRFDRS